MFLYLYFNTKYLIGNSVKKLIRLFLRKAHCAGVYLVAVSSSLVKNYFCGDLCHFAWICICAFICYAATLVALSWFCFWLRNLSSCIIWQLQGDEQATVYLTTEIWHFVVDDNLRFVALKAKGFLFSPLNASESRYNKYVRMCLTDTNYLNPINCDSIWISMRKCIC